jgi:hypothetical protein
VVIDSTAEFARLNMTSCRCRSGDVEAEIWVASALNYALVHCGLPVVHQLSVRNHGRRASSPVRVRISLPATARPAEVDVPEIAPGGVHVKFYIQFDWLFGELGSRTEREKGRIAVSVNNGPEEGTELWVLARDEWSTEPAHRTTLAAFVLPEDEQVRKLKATAEPYLVKATRGRARSFEDLGMSKKKGRSLLVMQAFYELFQSEWNISYAPPRGTQVDSQRIRLPHDLLDPDRQTGQGTCIDLVLLMAAGMESAGANPVIVIQEVETGLQHALIACWKDDVEHANPLALGTDRVLQQLAVTECIAFAWHRDKAADEAHRHDFTHARREAEDSLTKHGILYALDIAAARRGVSPLPFGVEPRPNDFASRVVRGALDLARRRGRGKVITAHLLLALVHAGGRDMLEVLRRLGVDAATAENRLLVSEQFQPGRFPEPVPTTKYLGVQKIAAVLAQQDGSAVVDERHLIRALLEPRSESVKEAVEALGVDWQSFKLAVRSACPGSGDENSLTTSRVHRRDTPDSQLRV